MGQAGPAPNLMPTLRDLLEFVCACAEQSGQPFTEDFTAELERKIRARYPAERLYVPPEGSRKGAGKAARIAELARVLPASTVAERLGVTPSYVRKIARRRLTSGP